MSPVGYFCASSSQKTFCSQKNVLPTSIVFIYIHIYIFLLRIKGEILPSRDANLALSALLHCNSFRPEFCLTQHIICKWIFKDLHIYITEFLSLKFSKSAEFCPEYVNSVACFPLLGTWWWWTCLLLTWMSHIKALFCYVWLANKCRFLPRVSLHKYLWYPLCILVF